MAPRPKKKPRLAKTTNSKSIRKPTSKENNVTATRSMSMITIR